MTAHEIVITLDGIREITNALMMATVTDWVMQEQIEQVQTAIDEARENVIKIYQDRLNALKEEEMQ